MPVLFATASNQGRRVKNTIYQMLGLAAMVFSLSACSNEAEDITTEKETAVEHARKHIDTRYVCPMHPKIIKDKPGKSCPICGMDLVEKKIDLSAQAHPVVELTTDIVQKLGVRTTEVEKGQLWKLIKTVGYVGFNEDRLKTITTKTDGWIENLAVRVKGLYVKKGQLLFELYSPEFLRIQQEFIATQKKDESGINRRYSSRQESIPSRDHLRYMEIPQSTINQIARKGKPQHRIRYFAPMQGTVIKHNIHKKQFISEGEELLTIADFSTVWVEANVYEHQLDWLRLGLTADVEVKALPGKKYQGEVNFINPVLDAKTRSLKVRLRVPNTDGRLKPNMFAYVKIYGGPKNDVVKIPREALIVTGERESVILDLGEGRYQPVDVVTGMHSNGAVEILSGLEKGEKIVTSGQFLIDSEANLQASFNRLVSE
jgi:Cu(I)/Ag(I) efflux system membrane fusion protein